MIVERSLEKYCTSMGGRRSESSNRHYVFTFSFTFSFSHRVSFRFDFDLFSSYAFQLLNSLPKFIIYP
jgi:hypothetical protein